MKIATIFFAHADAKRAFSDALRARMYTAGYEPHQVTDWFYAWFLPKKRAVISGTEDVERAADVALGIRGVMVKIEEIP
jgi:hypothetical protein